ncbi:hypothetical protein CVT26_002980 [Gymnopilus dilepis]|uniref:Uncharacterized protein n=1 Tax=Gymnopilus dilepis TaxID=231916 RepID=A0A409X9Q0_9AGAR|nr:hypothetical protein CVT26_002980 [Gymnopilus dilepis]
MNKIFLNLILEEDKSTSFPPGDTRRQRRRDGYTHANGYPMIMNVKARLNQPSSPVAATATSAQATLCSEDG